MKSISCKQAVDIILKKEEGKNSLLQYPKLWYHLWICPLCRYFLNQNKLINKLVAKRRKDQQYHLTDIEKNEIINHVLKQDKG